LPHPPPVAALVAAVASLFLVTPARGNPPDTGLCPIVEEVRIVSAVEGKESATEERKLVRSDPPVILYAVVHTRKALYTDAPGKKAQALPSSQWPAACPISLSWHKLEADVGSYDNSHSLPPAAIEYVETDWEKGWQAVADVHPTRMHDDFGTSRSGLGTMRYRLVVEAGGKTVATPGLECRESGALCRRIHLVAYRPDDTPLGFLHELFNTPYIYGSKTIKGGHQTDLLVGSDCADFAIYGKRRLRGRERFAYTFTGGLSRLSTRRTPVTLGSDGTYTDKKGKTLTCGPAKDVRPGDLLNLPGGHVVVLYGDDGDGILDDGDLVVHTLLREPELVRLRSCRWPVHKADVLRLKE
jgi:hypothetical protein